MMGRPSIHVMSFFVYIDETADGRPFYVGKGNAERLRKRDRNPYWKAIAAKHGWRRRIAGEFDTEAEAHELEVALIRLHGTFEADPEFGVWGANFTTGGEGVSGLRHSEESKKKMSEAHKKIPGHKLSDEHKTKLVTASAQSRIGRALSEDHKAKLRQALSGRTHGPKSDEHRAKLSAALIGKPLSDSHREAIGNGLKGKPRSEETKEKIAAARRGRPLSDSHREAIRAGHRAQKENPPTSSEADQGNSASDE